MMGIIALRASRVNRTDAWTVPGNPFQSQSSSADIYHTINMRTPRTRAHAHGPARTHTPAHAHTHTCPHMHAHKQTHAHVHGGRVHRGRCFNKSSISDVGQITGKKGNIAHKLKPDMHETSQGMSNSIIIQSRQLNSQHSFLINMGNSRSATHQEGKTNNVSSVRVGATPFQRASCLQPWTCRQPRRQYRCLCARSPPPRISPGG